MSRPRRRLFWRVYLKGLLLILLVGLAVTATTIFFQPESRFHGRPERLHQVLASELGRHLGKPQELQFTLERLCSAMGHSGAIYQRDGVMLAESGFQPPLALDEKDLSRIGGWHPLLQDGGWVHAVALGGEAGPYMLLKVAENSATSFFAALAAVLLVVALVSWPVARAFARPMERLTVTSRALAGGDLSARTGINRKDEMGEFARALDEMAGRLEERIRSEKELFANISHEIRTPLARLRVALELLEDAPADAKQTVQRLHGIGADLTELELLVDNVLTSARLDVAGSGNSDIPIRQRAVALDDFFADVTSRFERHYPGQAFEKKIASGLPNAMIDPGLLDRACDNLLDNAVKYNAPGRPVILTVTADGGRLKVEVSDFGEGVPAEELPRLFDPFFRSHRSRSRQTGGAGLGLTLCKRIVEAHGGKISARLGDEKGMTFRFELPITGNEDQETA